MSSGMEMIGFPGGEAMNARSQSLEANLKRLQQRSDDAKGDEQALRQVSRDLESLFVKMLLDSMEKTVPREEGSLGNSQAMQTWRGMLNEKLAEQLGENSPIGLADMIYRQLSGDLERHMEVPPATALPPDPGPNVQELPARPQSPPEAPVTGPGQPAGRTARVSGFRELIERAAANEGVDPALVAAMIAQESGGNPGAVSPAGSRGLMQLMPSTARMLGVANVFDPDQNVTGGVRYISGLLERYGGDERLALAAYNAGPGTVDRYGGVPPYRETTDYLEKVGRLKEIFRSMGFRPGV
ncbi:MAG: transglycosylase SLT domain-containing protein [Candidatus Glassbacteria bacterium]|nr:transglycosylase SLT domain-containing protein [Candidatus Glassbacteria bacterium]